MSSSAETSPAAVSHVFDRLGDTALDGIPQTYLAGAGTHRVGLPASSKCFGIDRLESANEEIVYRGEEGTDIATVQRRFHQPDQEVTGVSQRKPGSAISRKSSM